MRVKMNVYGLLASRRTELGHQRYPMPKLKMQNGQSIPMLTG